MSFLLRVKAKVDAIVTRLRALLGTLYRKGALARSNYGGRKLMRNPGLRTKGSTGFGKVFRMIADGVADGIAELRLRIDPIMDRLLGRIPKEKRHMVLIASAGAITFCLLLIIAFSLRSRDTRPGPPSPLPAQQLVIPFDELFLPFEPDFTPGVMLGRERRAEWTQADALPWWRNPLADGEERWRARIERMIDEIMESVP